MSDITVTVQDGVTVDVTVVDGNSVTVESPASSSITVTSKGPKGDTGETGPQGDTGPTGAGVAAGGTENQVLQKNSSVDYDTKWSAYRLPGADGDDGQVLTTNGAGTVSFAYPKTISENVKNVSGGILYKGTPVHVTGSVGNLAEVIAADAATNYPAHFVLDQDLDDEGEGQGIALGFINNVDVPDASIYSEGQTVYLGASGGWVTTKPTGTNAIQNLGIIIKVNVGGNKISGIVMGAGRANDVPNIPQDQFWLGNASGVATPTTFGIDLDSTPQLGGDLDVGANEIISTTGDIVVNPGALYETTIKSPSLNLKGAGTTNVCELKFYEPSVAGTNYVSFKPDTNLASNVSFTLPTADGSSGQFLKTNGSGNLSFATPSVNTNVGPWVSLGGRYQIDPADSNNMLISGGAFGPYYYIWSQSAGTTVSGGTVDTTTTTMSSFYQLYGGFQLPDNLKVKAKFALRNANSISAAQPIRFQIWSFPLESVSSTVTMTLRADYTFNTPANTYPADHTVTTTSALTADEYIICMFAVDNATWGATSGFVYCNIQLELVE